MDALELMEALDALNNLTDNLQAATDPFDQMDLIPQVMDAVEKLGGTAAAPKTTPPPEEPPKSVEYETPDVVTQFKAGDFVSSPSGDFLGILENLDMYVGHFITMQEVIDGASDWWRATGQVEASAAA